MNQNVLIDIIQEYATTIDSTLLPQTTVSSLGLKIALRMKQQFEELMKPQDEASKQELFARALVKLLASELDLHYTVESAVAGRIRLRAKDCPFKRVNSSSLCTVIEGIVGGLGLMTFGYCKIVPLGKSGTKASLCSVDVYVAPTLEAQSKKGLDYTKDSIILVQEGDDVLSEAQLNERRKTLLGVFNNLGFSLRYHHDGKALAQRFIESLSNLGEIGMAAIYLKDNARDRYVLAAQFGLRDDVLPLVREITDELDYVSSSSEDIIKINDTSSWCELGVCKRTVKAFTTIKLKSEERLVGALNIGWKQGSRLGPEYRETLQSACLLLSAIIDNSQLYFELEKTYIDSIGLLGRLVNVVDRFSKNHSRNVAELAEAIALEIGLPQEEATLLYEAGFIHDIGKITVPPEIFDKADRLTEEEFAVVKEHPLVAAKILAPITMYQRVIPAIQHHHERLDGSGYPEGLSGENIPLHARIIGVADVYDAMKNPRAHREASKEEEVIHELVGGKGTKYDPNVVDALLAVVRDRETVKTPSDDTPERLSS